MENKVRQTAGVKDVKNLIGISPVILNGGHLLKRAVDSVLMEYPSVDGIVQDSVIYLEGQLQEKQVKNIISALQKLGAKAITNQMQMSYR